MNPATGITLTYKKERKAMKTEVKAKKKFGMSNHVAGKIRNGISSAAIVGSYFLNQVAFAANNNSAELMSTVIGWIAKLIVVPGVILAIMGIIGYAQSHSEGDGPAQQKAIGKIAAAGMLILLSIIIGAAANTIVNYIVAQ